MPMQHSKKIYRHHRNDNYIRNVALKNYWGKNKDTLTTETKGVTNWPAGGDSSKMLSIAAN